MEAAKVAAKLGTKQAEPHMVLANLKLEAGDNEGKTRLYYLDLSEEKNRRGGE